MRHWVGIKDYVLWKLLRVLVTDNSMASGTGLMDIQPVAMGSGEPGPCRNLARSAAGTGRDKDGGTRATTRDGEAPFSCRARRQ